MRFGRRGIVTTAAAVVLAWGGVASGAAARAEADLATRVLDLLQREREAAGAPPLDRRAALDRVAESLATHVASKPHAERMSSGPPVAEALRQEGVRLFVRAVERRFVMRTFNPMEVVRRQWRASREGWGTAMSSDIHAYGGAAAWTDDGYLVFVAVLLQDTVLPMDLESLAREVAEQVNVLRMDRGLQPLLWEPALAEVARRHSEDMARRDYLSHESPEGVVAASRVDAAGIAYRYLAENLARNRNTADPRGAAVDGWMDSPGHRRNILSDEVTHTGVGVAVATDGSVFFTQLFVGR